MSAFISQGHRAAFLTPRIFSVMASNPALACYLSNTAVVAKVKEITENPNTLDTYWSAPAVRNIADVLSKQQTVGNRYQNFTEPFFRLTYAARTLVLL